MVSEFREFHTCWDDGTM